MSDPIKSIPNRPCSARQPRQPDDDRRHDLPRAVPRSRHHARSALAAARRTAEPGRTANFRTAAFDLDSVYGEGPERRPSCTTRAAATSLQGGGDSRLGRSRATARCATTCRATAAASDHRRQPQRRERRHLAAPRGDAALPQRRRRTAARATAQQGRVGAADLRAGAAHVRWHYQWCIVHEFLPVDDRRQTASTDAARGPRFYTPQCAQRDLTAARSPDSDRVLGRRLSLRPFAGATELSAELRSRAAARRAVLRLLFDDAAGPDMRSTQPDLRGGRRAPRRFVDWQTFFDFGDGNVGRTSDRHQAVEPAVRPAGLARAVPGATTDGVQSLASRNLLRHVNFGLPSGQDDRAAHVGAPVLSADAARRARSRTA